MKFESKTFIDRNLKFFRQSLSIHKKLYKINYIEMQTNISVEEKKFGI